MREFHESQYTKPRWTPERRAAASAAARARIQTKIDLEAAKVFDPGNQLNRLERLILSRIASSDDRTAYEVATDTWPILESMKAWFAFMAMETSGHIKRNWAHDDSMMQNRWRLTGCGRLFVAVKKP